MLTDLTPEHDTILDDVAAEYIACLTRPDPYDDAAVRAWLRIAYDACGLPMPDRVEVVDSPDAACELASVLTGETIAALDSVGVADAAWVARYDAYHRLGVLSDAESAELLALRAYLRCAWDHILLDECAIVVRRPTTLSLDEAGNLHSVDGPAIAWADGHPDYAHHGVWVSERIALDPRGHTRAEYLAITDTEVRRALGERAGWQWVAELLGAKIANTWTDPRTGLRYELLSLADGGGKLLRKESPTLQDGSQPWYVEPVHEDLRHAQAARKWQAGDWSVEECEADPELSYGAES
jgi:hypothetical protein